MLSHIVSDLHEHYVKEILEPKIGKNIPNVKSSDSSGGEKTEDDLAKQARQLVYDVRYRARREDIPLDKAYTQHIGNSPAPSKVKEIAKEKLFGKSGASSGAPITPVKENFINEESKVTKFKVRVTDKSSGKTYVRMATREKINQLRANPNISSVEMTKYGKPYEGEEKKGELTAKTTSGKGIDYDKDGKVETGSKEHAGVVHNAIQRAKGGIPDGKDTRKKNRKSHGMSEGFFNWREDLIEVADSDEKKRPQVKEKKIKNKITINPNLKIENAVKNLGGKLIGIVEEECLEDEQVVDIFENVTNAEIYFMSNDLIEEVVEEFFVECLDEGYDIDFIIESTLQSLDNSIDILNEEVLMELNPYAPAGSKESQHYNKATTQSKRSAEKAAKRAEKIKKVKDTVKKIGSSIKSGIKKTGKAASYGAGYAAAKVVSSAKKVGSQIKSGYEAGKDSKETEKSEKPAKSTTRFKTRSKTRSKTLSKIGSVLKTGLKKAVGKAARSVSRGARNVARSMGEEYDSNLQEKITAKTDVGTAVKDFYSSKSPQLAGRTKEQRRQAAIAAVLTARRGGKKLGEALDQKIVDQQTSSDDNVRSSQSDSIKKQQIQNLKMIQQKRQMLDRQKLMMKKSGKLPMDAESYEPEGDVIDELTSYARETGKKYTTGRKSVSGGNPQIKARVENEPWLKYGGSRQKPKDRTGKVVPVAAGEPGSGRQSPEHIVKSRRAKEQGAKEQRHGSRHD